MTREEAKDFVLKTLRTGDGQRVTLVLKRYFSKFCGSNQPQDQPRSQSQGRPHDQPGSQLPDQPLQDDKLEAAILQVFFGAKNKIDAGMV